MSDGWLLVFDFPNLARIEQKQVFKNLETAYSCTPSSRQLYHYNSTEDTPEKSYSTANKLNLENEKSDSSLTSSEKDIQEAQRKS